jgi:hypothetical protein
VSDDLIGLNLVLTCQRSDCDERIVIDVGEVRMETPGAFTGGVASSLVSELVEYGEDEPNDTWNEIQGWGWDTSDGVNRALHCPQHRQEGPDV